MNMGHYGGLRNVNPNLGRVGESGKNFSGIGKRPKGNQTILPAGGEPIQNRKQQFWKFRSNEGLKDMEIKRIGSQPSVKGPAEWFTGAVRIDPLFQAPDPAMIQCAGVTFEPGARTAWHTHPLGQTLVVTAGCGWAQRWGGPVEEIRPGDVVWFSPGEKHWHGATPTTAMAHIAIQEKLDGKVVEWLEQVSDGQYQGRLPSVGT
jgi:quercetin dioxygenase-like cupin family protein